MLKRKKSFDSFNDGIIEFGDYIESYDENNNACEEKEFSVKGRLLFSYKTIREQDRLKYDDTGVKVAIKIKTYYLPNLKSSNTIRLNNTLYSIAHIDPDNSKEKMYIYLTELKNDMSKHISIYTKIDDNNPLTDDKWDLFRTVWGDIEAINTVKTLEDTNNGKVENKLKKKFIIRYLKELDATLNKQVTVQYKIKYKNYYYNIVGTNNVEEKDEILELEAVIE